MATSGEATDAFSGRSRFRLRIAIALDTLDSANNRSKWDFSLRVDNLDESSATWSGDTGPYSISIAGQSFTGTTPAGSFDFRDGDEYHNIRLGTTGWIAHNSNGTKTIPISASISGIATFGNASASGTVVAPVAGTVPPAPTPLGIDQITATSFRYRMASNGTGGVAFSRWEVQYSLSPGFTTGNGPVTTSTGTTVFTGRTPGTVYYVRSRGVNTLGAGPWSSVISAATSSMSPPGFAVTPSPSGFAATVALVPPVGVTPDSYTIEWRMQGSTDYLTMTGPSPFNVTGLIPGVWYEWRARTNAGAYISDWTGWSAVQQTNPSILPGEYFDGSSVARPDTSYAWVGTTNNSTSTAIGKVPDGWSTFFDGLGFSGGTGATYRVTGGFAGDYAMRVMWWSDADDDGFVAGIDPNDDDAHAEIDGNSIYHGSIYVKVPERIQRMAAQMWFFDEFHAFLGDDVMTGASSVVGADWTRLTVAVTPPPGAVYAAVYAVDVNDGGEWAPWRAGDYFDVDAAMISRETEYPYFDGDTPATPDFTYDWVGAPNASISQRVTLDPNEVDPLLDPMCAVPPAPPRPPVIAENCIEAAGMWNRFWMLAPGSDVSDWMATVPTLEIVVGNTAVRQVRIRYYATTNQNFDEIDPLSFCSEQIISYIPPDTTFWLDGVNERAIAFVPGFGDRRADHLVYGSGGTPPVWPQLGCGLDYLISFDVPTGISMDDFTPYLRLTARGE